MFKKVIWQGLLTLALGTLLFLAGSSAAHADVANGVIRPHDGAMISGSTGVNGIADDPQFAAWQLDLLPLNDPNTVYFVGRGTQAAPMEGRLGRLDSARYPDGDYRLRLRVIRTDGNYSEYFTSLGIENGPPGTNRITSPLPGTTINCLATIEAIAHSDTFVKYQLDLLLSGNENQVVPISKGTQPHYASGTVGQLDTTKVPDGNHTLRLRVVKNDGNYDTYYTPVVVDNGIMKDALARGACGCSVPDPTASPSVANGITNPLPGAVVRGMVPVCGDANDFNLDSWEVDLLFGNDESTSVMVAYGQNPDVTRAPFTMLDTTALPDGLYTLQLKVGRADNTLSQYNLSMCIRNNQPTSSSPASGCASPLTGILSFPYGGY